MNKKYSSSAYDLELSFVVFFKSCFVHYSTLLSLEHIKSSLTSEVEKASGPKDIHIFSSVIVFGISSLLFAFLNLFLPFIPSPLVVSYTGAFLKLLHQLPNLS